MSTAPEIANLLHDLETRLLDPEVRRDPATLNSLLAPGFSEITSTGEVLAREQVIQALQAEPPLTRKLIDFRARLLAPTVALCTFTLIRESTAGPIRSRRASIWQLDGDKWQMVFHQGTPQST